ncbi:unnamed protein product [Moneuplotes crassus]|uniref:Uncharacterized protein n=1 Tax=Euplotes crassus TaxID=5936 RepID=A0AAD1XKZ9_EUPCR|nr:unnamed protein product [Moneuplotes crassus]
MLTFLTWDIHIWFAWVVGIYTFVHSICMVTKCLIRNFVRNPLDLSKRYGDGSWVLVTGATGGIGEEYCLQLAQKGFNIIISGRNKQAIEEMEANVKKTNTKVKTKALVADLSQTISPSFYEKLINEVKDLDISILINNAASADSAFFEDVSLETHLDRARINIGAPTMLCHKLITKLLGRNKKSCIINISSLSQTGPIPFVGEYSGSKRFVSLLSYHLHDNYGDKIDIQDLMPGFVTTKINRYYKGPDAITAKECVESSLRDLGQEFSTIPALSHSAEMQLFHLTYHFCKPFFRMLAVGACEKRALELYYQDNSHNSH